MIKLPKSRYDIGDPTRISEYFAWGEVTHSVKAIELGIPNPLSPLQAANAVKLHDSILYPLRKYIGVPFHVTSWVRGVELNRAVGGVQGSYHRLGLALDGLTHKHTTFELVEIIQSLGLRYDQVINEFQKWTHIQAPKAPNRPRLEVLTAYKSTRRTRYVTGNRAVDPITNKLIRSNP